MAEIYQLPDGNNNGNSIPFSIPIGFGGMGGGIFGGNYGMNGIADLFGLAIIASMFGWSSPFSPTTSGAGSPKKELESFENVENQ